MAPRAANSGAGDSVAGIGAAPPPVIDPDAAAGGGCPKADTPFTATGDPPGMSSERRNDDASELSADPGWAIAIGGGAALDCTCIDGMLLVDAERSGPCDAWRCGGATAAAAANCADSTVCAVVDEPP